jgi:hypothetical protein
MTTAAPANSPFDRLIRSTAYKAMKPDEKLSAMLKHKTFEQLLKDGDLYDANGAAQRSGYTPQHIRRLCRTPTRLDHLTRGAGEDAQLYFLPEQLDALFTYKKAKSS